MHSEQELVKGCLRNSRLHQQALYEKYSSKMFAVCLRYAPDRMLAEDFLQEGFVKVFTRLDQFNGQGSLEGWIRRVMVNTALQYLRSQKNAPQEVDIEHSQHISNGDTGVLDSLAVEELTKMVQKLPAGYRMVFNMYVIEEYTHKEIAAELGITEGTSKSQLARARGLLQKMIKKNENISHTQFIETGVGR
jgi:RNA polymerase sigma-70 factor (ECF subfamily)